VNKSTTLRSALVIVGGGLAAVPAAALQLGDAEVQSKLGQPLRASIAYALGPNESISNTCIAVQPTGGAPAAVRGNLAVGDGVITFTGSSVVREPLLSVRISVDCHYTARISREYMLFIDPMSTEATETPVIAPEPRRAAAQPVRNVPRVTPKAAVAEPTTIVQEPVAATPPVEIPEPAVAEPVVSAQEGAAYEPVDAPETQAVDEPALETSPPPIAELQPGDVVIGNEDMFAEPIETVSDEAANIPAPRPSIIRQPEPVQDGFAVPGWLLWLGGGVAAAAFALLLFGRRVYNYFGSSPIAPAESKPRKPLDEAIEETQAVDALDELDVLIDDDSPTAENLALDADLVMGTGLQEGSDVEVAQDFDFAATTDIDLDLELPDETAAAVESPETDILPPLHAHEQEILESEVLPEDDDDEYDYSVMLDATKMPNPEDVTERDLEAIEVDDDDDTLIGNDYTVSKEVDYKVLEQDYEDEITATQALNEEIMKAAEEAGINDDLDITAEVAANDMPKGGKKAG
jgi:hypothetical protein